MSPFNFCCQSWNYDDIEHDFSPLCFQVFYLTLNFKDSCHLKPTHVTLYIVYTYLIDLLKIIYIIPYKLSFEKIKVKFVIFVCISKRRVSKSVVYLIYYHTYKKITLYYIVILLKTKLFL